MEIIPEISNHNLEAEIGPWKMNFIMLIYAEYVIQLPSIAWQIKPNLVVKKNEYFIMFMDTVGQEFSRVPAGLASCLWFMISWDLTGNISMAGTNWGWVSSGCFLICICDKTELREFKGQAQLGLSIEILSLGLLSQVPCGLGFLEAWANH